MFRRPDRLIIPQYEAPQEPSLLASAELLGEGKRAIAAQVIDFAVRKVITISREAGKGKGSGFTLTIASDIRTEKIDEKNLLVHLFGPGPYDPGASVRVQPGRNRELGQRLGPPHRDAAARLIAKGFARERPLLYKIVSFWRKQPISPLPPAYPTIDHLWGIHDYVKLAEKERLAFLQSPSGAQRREPLNNLEVLVLHEKLLPYAVLFGLEKEWMRELDLRYREIPPDLLATIDDVAVFAEFVVMGVQLIEVVADLAVLVDAADALSGVGAVLGGIGEALANLDLPDLPDFG